MRDYNSRSSSSSTYVGVSFIELLQLVFIVLKLCKIITWSWVWVLAPTWIGLIIFILVVIAVIYVFK